MELLHRDTHATNIPHTYHDTLCFLGFWYLWWPHSVIEVIVLKLNVLKSNILNKVMALPCQFRTFDNFDKRACSRVLVCGIFFINVNAPSKIFEHSTWYKPCIAQLWPDQALFGRSSSLRSKCELDLKYTIPVEVRDTFFYQE